MSSPMSNLSVTDSSARQASHFMRLPTEVREMIYRPLLIARYTMREHDMTTKEYNDNRLSIKGGPDQKYVFETAILATNRKIHEEAKDLCRRENDFVCLTSRHLTLLFPQWERLGLQIIAKRSNARSFWNISMSLTLDGDALDDMSQNRGGWFGNANPEVRPPWKSYIFCSDQLPELCRFLVEFRGANDRFLRNLVLCVDISPAVGKEHTTEIDSSPAGRTRMRKFFDPLRQLHSLGAVQIDGPLSGSYKSKVITSVCKPCPTAMAIIHETVISLNKADELANEGQFRHAKLEYNAALSLIRSCCWRYREQEFTMDEGPFPGLKAFQAVSNLVVRLQARIAVVYLRSEKLRMARIYTDRAMDPRRPIDRRGNKEYYLEIKPWEGIVYAEVLHVAAIISYTHGDVHEAIRRLREAREFVLFNEEQASRYKAWQAHAERLRERYYRRQETRSKQKEKQSEKLERKIQVVGNWKKKGDRLIRSGRSILATSAYKTAIEKLERLKNHSYRHYFLLTANPLQSRRALDAIHTLSFKLHAALAAAGLMYRKYEEVGRLTESVLARGSNYDLCVHGLWWGCDYMYCYVERDWAKHLKLDLVKIHYCRALSLHHLGDTVSAIEHMEEALSLDRGDGTVFAQLVLLKQQQLAEAEAEAEARKQRLESLNGLQIKLRKKQARRRAKA